MDTHSLFFIVGILPLHSSSCESCQLVSAPYTSILNAGYKKFLIPDWNPNLTLCIFLFKSNLLFLLIYHPKHYEELPEYLHYYTCCTDSACSDQILIQKFYYPNFQPFDEVLHYLHIMIQ